MPMVACLFEGRRPLGQLTSLGPGWIYAFEGDDEIHREEWRHVVVALTCTRVLSRHFTVCINCGEIVFAVIGLGEQVATGRLGIADSR